MKCHVVYYVLSLRQMHEWLSGGASPCQGEGRGFESRLVLFSCPEFRWIPGFLFYKNVLGEDDDEDCKNRVVQGAAAVAVFENDYR